jgi:hypothetical protein
VGRKRSGYHVLDFTLERRSDDAGFVADMKCEIEFEGYKDRISVQNMLDGLAEWQPRKWPTGQDPAGLDRRTLWLLSDRDLVAAETRGTSVNSVGQARAVSAPSGLSGSGCVAAALEPLPEDRVEG